MPSFKMVLFSDGMVLRIPLLFIILFLDSTVENASRGKMIDG
jgi:hypothetical protein